MLARFAPALFVLLWSSGFVATKLGSAGAEPFTFLIVRFVLVLGLLIPASLLLSTEPLTLAGCRQAMMAGVLLHAVYLGGTMSGMRAGLASNVAALIVSLQPVLTALLAGFFLKERLLPRHWAGVALGLAGAALVIGPKLLVAGGAGAIAGGITPASVTLSLTALVGITLGTIYQKRHATGLDPIAGTVWQYVGALVAVIPMALIFEHGQIDWTPGVIGALAWLVVLISIGAISLLMMLIRENAVSRISGLFYLVPGVTALMSFAFFGESLSLVQMAGLIVVTVAVVLMQPAKAADPSPS